MIYLSKTGHTIRERLPLQDVHRGTVIYMDDNYIIAKARKSYILLTAQAKKLDLRKTEYKNLLKRLLK